jgi:hypothetical protein
MSPAATTPEDLTASHGCIWCEREKPFEMPDGVVNACLNGNLVVFAGAGISTESATVVPRPLYLEMQLELGRDPCDQLSFPQVMTAFEDAHHRPALLQRIKKHLDYVKSFPNIDGEAGRFHRELAGVYTITEIVTTNWDDYFERNCGAQPFVTEQDWAFWKSSERKVFKLHGSIANPGSIIATEADYKRCYRNLNRGLVGAELKKMLATKTVVFIGYSIRDSDFVALYRLMKRRMGNLLPRAYVVTLDDGETPAVAQGMHLICTSGAHFVHTLKQAFPEDELVPDERFDALPFMRALVSKLHHEMIAEGEMRDEPALLMCACYQDGLMDAFDHQMANAAKGDYFHRCYTEGLLRDVYRRLYDERVEDGVWQTVAYLEGYMNGLAFLISDDDKRKTLPLYYVAGFDGKLRTREDYERAARQFPELSPAVYEYAKGEAAKLKPGVVFQHMPSL